MLSRPPKREHRRRTVGCGIAETDRAAAGERATRRQEQLPRFDDRIAGVGVGCREEKGAGPRLRNRAGASDTGRAKVRSLRDDIGSVKG